jgi:hypothetical protein
VAAKTLYFRNVQGGAPAGSWELRETAPTGAEDATSEHGSCTDCGGAGGNRKAVLIKPGVSNSTFVTGLPDTTAPPTTGNRFGWFSESSYNGTFASAAWTVQVRSDDNRAQITGEPILNVYKCTEKSFVSGTWTFLFQTTEASAADWWVNATATISWTETPAQITLSDEFLFVNVFCHEHSSASGFLHHFRMEGSALSEAQVSKIVTSDFTLAGAQEPVTPVIPTPGTSPVMPAGRS